MEGEDESSELWRLSVLVFLNWPILGSFLFIFVFSTLHNSNKN